MLTDHRGRCHAGAKASADGIATAVACRAARLPACDHCDSSWLPMWHLPGPPGSCRTLSQLAPGQRHLPEDASDESRTYAPCLAAAVRSNPPPKPFAWPRSRAHTADYLRLPSHWPQLAGEYRSAISERSKSGRAYRSSGSGPAWQSRGRAWRRVGRLVAGSGIAGSRRADRAGGFRRCFR
jgi:hypothetical protein